MKKFFTKIIISAVVLAIFLAPVSPSFQKNSDGDLAINLKNNVALADAEGCLAGTITTPCFTVINHTEGVATDIRVTVKNIPTDIDLEITGGLVKSPENTTVTTETKPLSNTISEQTVDLFLGVPLTTSTQYYARIILREVGQTVPLQDTPVDIKTTANAGEINTDTNGNSLDIKVPDEFGCSPVSHPTSMFQQCIVAGVFYLVWTPISKIAVLAANVLDFFVYYSTNSSSFSGSFIGSAWASVRDIANIFFIIALLYVAIQTILGLGHGPQKMIATIVIVALLINFSLFFTEVIIDASNILAKVFYNHIDAVNANGAALTGSAGQKSITVNLVSAFNPQTMIAIKADKPGLTFVTILLSIVLMCFMIYIFLSVAILFVGRVAGLWISMIMAPIAFASYTLPFDIPGLGHKEWWDNLLKQAFMAPIFIFFLYIILLLGKSFKLITADVSNSDQFLDTTMKVFIPFLLIFILLREAKKLAVKYSGEMGSAFTSAGAVVGGLALGGIAMGGALIGRRTIGTFMKGASTGDTAANRMVGANARIAAHNATIANPASTIVERTHARKEIQRERADQLKGNLQQALGLQAMKNWVGTRLNQDQGNVAHAAHARHDLDTAASAVRAGAKWDDLNGGERVAARTNMERDRERRIHGWGNRAWAQLSPAEQGIINALVNPRVATNTTNADNTIIPDSRVKQGVISSAVQSTITGGYDVRSLSKIIAGEQDTSFNKLASGITSLMAGGMRSSIKSAVGAHYGEGQKDIFKDLGHTITEAMKGAKISVDLSHVGEEKKEAPHGGGHH